MEESLVAQEGAMALFASSSFVSKEIGRRSIRCSKHWRRLWPPAVKIPTPRLWPILLIRSVPRATPHLYIRLRSRCLHFIYVACTLKSVKAPTSKLDVQDNYNALHIAAMYSREDVVKLLLTKKGIDVYAPGGPKSQTAVHLVASRQTGTATSILRALLASAGRDIRTSKDSAFLLSKVRGLLRLSCGAKEKTDLPALHYSSLKKLYYLFTDAKI
ncbi:unnamed protein product [Nesidiocoris tenuis]|uniref:Uncharacterized protein n=1 Tax=Nesidiocoris tenuis TaxID=355587 RepID=A0A6H5H3G4_9HEMI|nr:unnamed protein product [Nesidiocoris tenuis]